MRALHDNQPSSSDSSCPVRHYPVLPKSSGCSVFRGENGIFEPVICSRGQCSLHFCVAGGIQWRVVLATGPGGMGTYTTPITLPGTIMADVKLTLTPYGSLADGRDATHKFWDDLETVAPNFASVFCLSAQQRSSNET